MPRKSRTNEECFIRSQTGLRLEGTCLSQGVFAAVGHLEDSTDIDEWSEQRLHYACEWFNQHVPVPSLEREHYRALFWFRESCTELIHRLWDVVYVLREHGIDVDLLHSSNPGQVCYEDRYQIAAVPWRRRPRRLGVARFLEGSRIRLAGPLC